MLKLTLCSSPFRTNSCSDSALDLGPLVDLLASQSVSLYIGPECSPGRLNPETELGEDKRRRIWANVFAFAPPFCRQPQETRSQANSAISSCLCFKNQCQAGSSRTHCQLQVCCQVSSILWCKEPSEGAPRAGRRMGGQFYLACLHSLKAFSNRLKKSWLLLGSIWLVVSNTLGKHCL